jgi:hypothetical protein
MNLTSNTNLKQIGKQRRAGLWLTATLGSSFLINMRRNRRPLRQSLHRNNKRRSNI